jgi:hypothetical protein
VDFEKLNVIEGLPLSRSAPQGAEALFRRLRGATIVQIGSTDEDGIEGGGLIIDYIAPGERIGRRVVFAFNESGMWIVFESGSEG